MVPRALNTGDLIDALCSALVSIVPDRISVSLSSESTTPLHHCFITVLHMSDPRRQPSPDKIRPRQGPSRGSHTSSHASKPSKPRSGPHSNSRPPVTMKGLTTAVLAASGAQGAHGQKQQVPRNGDVAKHGEQSRCNIRSPLIFCLCFTLDEYSYQLRYHMAFTRFSRVSTMSTLSHKRRGIQGRSNAWQITGCRGRRRCRRGLLGTAAQGVGPGECGFPAQRA